MSNLKEYLLKLLKQHYIKINDNNLNQFISNVKPRRNLIQSK